MSEMSDHEHTDIVRQGLAQIIAALDAAKAHLPADFDPAHREALERLPVILSATFSLFEAAEGATNQREETFAQWLERQMRKQ